MKNFLSAGVLSHHFMHSVRKVQGENETRQPAQWWPDKSKYDKL